MKRSLFILLSVVLSLSACYPQKRPAGKLSLVITSNLQLDTDGRSLVGFINIANRSEQRAEGVYPTLRIGQWEWGGEPALIRNGTEYKWEVREEIDLAQIIQANSVAGNGQLAGLAGSTNTGGAVSTDGMLPITIRGHYQDLHGGSFSTSAVKMLSFNRSNSSPAESIPQGAANSGNGASLCSGTIVERMSCTSTGKSGSCAAEILNQGTNKIIIENSVHTSKEIVVSNQFEELGIVSIEPGTTKTVNFSYSGNSALPGSSYTLFLISAWNHEQSPCAAFVSGQISIHRNPFTGRILLMFAGMTAAAGILYRLTT